MLVKKYQKPIIITENGYDMHVPPQAKDGAKADDTDMPAYLVNHLYQLHRAIADGADVRGYLYWSFIDNYEWNHGLNMRFGMFAYNPKDPLKTRIERSAVPIFKQIASLNAIPHNLIIQYLNQ
jgi:beta-galactosidase